MTLPIIGRAMPIVGDEAIQPEFGTGCLKVTPGHDPVDFEIGQRHNLPAVTVIGPDGRITAEGGPVRGLRALRGAAGGGGATGAGGAAGEGGALHPFGGAVPAVLQCTGTAHQRAVVPERG